jgi:predicted HAD superfamily hydrolase
MENQNYKTEFNLFEKVFHSYKDKRIILYGLGRHTVSLLPAMSEYNFVGLMDRDPENIGKVIYGIPVISVNDAEKVADIIIINTAEAYWETIFHRISHLNIPIFYRNGQRAQYMNRKDDYKSLPYWETSYDKLKACSMSYDVISFDIFDTLIMRKVYSPTDIFRLMDLKLKKQCENFSTLRNNALSRLGDKEYVLTDLYKIMNELAMWSEKQTEEIMRLELETEESAIVPRSIIVDLFLELQCMGKELYLISDMYLPKEFIIKVLNKFGINISLDNILLSGELGMSKREGGLWSYYKKYFVKERTTLHIGDNRHSDIENAEKEEINTFYIMNASDLLKNSSLGMVEPHIHGIYESIVMGILCAKLFENPFSLNEKKGVVGYNDFKLLGYCWFGNVIFTYLLWLQQKCEELGHDQIIFLARDGYFLMEDYKYLLELLDNEIEYPAIYLPISRRLIMIAAITDDKTLHDAIVFPYIGSWEDYINDRFDLTILAEDEHKHEQVNASADGDKIKEWLRPYQTRLRMTIEEERNNYLKLLKAMKLSTKAAVTDVGYYGNTQHYLNKLLKKDLSGFYFSADLSVDNKCARDNQMYACFQKVDDSKANSCNLHRQTLILESYLTAPHGMIKKVDSKGNSICDSNKNSQDKFQDRIEMNEGVKEFIKDYLNLISEIDLGTFKVKTEFADILYGVLINYRGELSQDIIDSFYWDNGMVQRRESKIFE